MFKINRITNLFELQSSWKDHISIYVDYQPDVEFENPKHVRIIRSNLWYHHPAEEIYDTYLEYWVEKLAVTDPTEGKMIINEWNKLFLSNKIPQVSFKATFSISDRKFGVLDTIDTERFIVFTNYDDRPPHTINAFAGRGGYLWNYLDDQKLTDKNSTHDLLKEKLGLYYKSDRVRFIKKWNKLGL